MSGYEYSLRRLFRQPIDHLPPSDQLQFYHQRNLVPSHLYRLGTGILGGSPPRRRVIDASLYAPPGGTPHAQLIWRSLDGRVKPVGRSPTTKEGLTSGACVRPRSLTDPAMAAHQFTEEEYRGWVGQRQRLRADLEAMGASQRWLLSKERTPLETFLLSHMRRGRGQGRREGPGKGDQTEEEHPSLSSPRLQRPQGTDGSNGRQRRLLLKEVALLQQFLARHRKRLVSLLMATDKARDRLISSGEFTTIMAKLRVPVSAATLDTVVSALQATSGAGGGEDCKIDYRTLLNGNLFELVTAYLDKTDSQSTQRSQGRTKGVVSDAEPSKGKEEEEEEVPAASLQRHMAPSTMGGEVGRLTDNYREESLRQFQALLDYCTANGVVLSWKLAEKALLLPPDKTRRECLAGLRQPGLELLSSHFSDPPESDSEASEAPCPQEEFGGAYKGLRGRRKKRLQRLSTGVAWIGAKTDCWLTFDDFEKLTGNITSRPGFKHKHHGLPDNNAFWPGALLDKLRLWLPSETLLDKPTSHFNVFQPVQHPKIYNPQGPVVDQRRSWPENASGYVQFGSQTRKRYHL